MEKKVSDYAFVFFVGEVSIAPAAVKKTPTGDLTHFNISVEQGTNKKASYRVAAWNGYAKPCFEHVKSGDRVTVCGTLKMQTFPLKDGGVGKSAEIKLFYINFGDIGTWTEEFDKYIAFRDERRRSA